MIAPVAASTVPDGVAMLALPSVPHWGGRSNDPLHINHGAGKSTLDSANGYV